MEVWKEVSGGRYDRLLPVTGSLPAALMTNRLYWSLCPSILTEDDDVHDVEPVVLSRLAAATGVVKLAAGVVQVLIPAGRVPI